MVSVGFRSVSFETDPDPAQLLKRIHIQGNYMGSGGSGSATLCRARLYIEGMNSLYIKKIMSSWGRSLLIRESSPLGKLSAKHYFIIQKA